MSDSEDDFASADEGEIEANPTGIINDASKGSHTKSEGSKVAGKCDKAGASSLENTHKHGLKDSKVSGKREKVVCGKTDKKDKDSDVVQKCQSGNGGKGKRKGKKGKGGEKIPSGKKLVEKTDDSLDRDAIKQTNEKKTENTPTEIMENKSDLVDEKEGKSENSNDIVKEAVSQSDNDNVATPSSDKDSNVTNASTEELKPESISDSSSSPSITEKAELLKSPSSQNISRMDPDNCEKEDAGLNETTDSVKQTKSGWSWGWGSSLLEVASSSVSTFTHQVGEGLHTMMETVESTLNVPNPEELAQKVDEERDTNAQETSKSTEDEEPAPADNSNKDKNTENQPDTSIAPIQPTNDEKTVDNQSADGWFSAWGVSNISKIVENTGKSLVTGSLDVLETLGKKTFDVINEQDPGLKVARSFLNDSHNKPNLSAMLRDAKEQNEAEAEHRRESEEAHKAHFGSLFDDFHGLAHLEALEILSNQSEKRVNVHLNALSSESLAELKPNLLQIKQMFEIDEVEENATKHDFTLMVKDLFQKLNVRTTPDKLLQACDRIGEKIAECNDTETTIDVKEIHRLAISSLAEFTSKCMEHFHKIGELILIQKSDDVNFVDCSKTLLGLSQVMAAEIGILSTKFSECLNKQEIDDERELNQFVTNIYLEANNSSSYIQDGFQLLLPVLQQAAIETSREQES